MRRPLRTSLLVMGIVAIIGVVHRTLGSWQRFKEQQFVDGEVKPTGWLARTYARMAPWTNEWLYAMFARRLNLQPEDQILDVACGSGAFLRKHAAHVFRIAGLDHSQDLIEIALRENQERVAAGTAEFVTGDATTLPWGDDEFSVVTSNCIDCFKKKELPALQEMYRVLQPGGRALVADDRSETMEAAGFTRVSTERILWGCLTTGFKD